MNTPEGSRREQAHGQAHERARRVVGGLARAGGRAASEAAFRAVRRADEAARGALPGGVRGGIRFTGSQFQRELGTATATRPHARTASTLLLGPTWKQTPLRRRWRRSKTLRNEGFDASSRPDPHLLDVAELAHIHGNRLPSMMSLALLHHQEDREHPAGGSGSADGSLHRVVVSERDRARGAVDWTRLCVDTDQEASFLQVVDDRHLDVLIAAVGQSPAENAADVGLILPQGLPPRVTAALTADPQRPTVRLHLLGKSRVAVDDGESYRQLRGVPHALRGSLVVTLGQVTRAELWVATRRNVLPWLVGGLG